MLGAAVLGAVCGEAQGGSLVVESGGKGRRRGIASYSREDL